jgi:hypothetical protein
MGNTFNRSVLYPVIRALLSALTLGLSNYLKRKAATKRLKENTDDIPL